MYVRFSGIRSSNLQLVELVVNGRPITKLSDDMRDPMPFTSNHLLLIRSGLQLPPGKFVKQDIYMRSWRQVQYLSDIFWQRWLKEYLPQLQERQIWYHPQRNVRSGGLVLVMHENTPRYQWPLGLVRETFQGKDGKIRSLQLKTQKTPDPRTSCASLMVTRFRPHNQQ